MIQSQTGNPRDKGSIQDKIKELQFKDQIQRFNQNLQKGDLGLSQIIKNGFILYGDTRAGKTALGHILSGSSLKCIKISGQFMVELTTSKNRKARIGNTMNSQTLIPNNFTVKLKEREQQKFNVIDTPGYGDTNGLLTIFANGYYHYRLYSKVLNMKFIICFDAIQLQNTCAQFIKTIKQWTNSFADYLQVKKQIWKSVAFVITKVQDKPTIKEDLIAKLESITKNMSTLYEKNVQEAIKEFIEFVVKEDRIFYVKKIKEGDTLVQADLLERINKKITHWWTRQYDHLKKQVDMTPVSFPLSEQIIESTTSSTLCRRQFIQLINYYNLRIKEFLSKSSGTGVEGQDFSLGFVIEKLVEDAMGHPDSHDFIDAMKSYVDLYYKKYDESYKQQREKLEKEMFSIGSDEFLTEKSRNQFRGKDKNYMVKKFRCLKQIEHLKAEINNIQLDERDINSIELCATNVYEIIKELNKVAFKRNLASQIIYKYGYIIHRIIEEAKIFTLLIDIYGAKDKMEILNKANGQFFELLRKLIDFMGVAFKYNKQQSTYEQIHLAFIKNFSFNQENYKQLVINQDLVSFFTSVDIIDEDNEDNIDKQIQVVLRYSDKVLEETEKLSTIIFDKQKGKLIRRLTNIRINCESKFNMRKQPNQRNYYMFTIRQATKNLAKILQLLGQFRLSRQVYSTIRFVDSVCKLYRLEINSLSKANMRRAENNQSTRTKEIELRLEFSHYLQAHCREYQAIEVLQETFEIAENMTELKIVRQDLINLRGNLKAFNPPSNPTQYEIGLFQEVFFDIFSSNLIKELENYSKNAIV